MNVAVLVMGGALLAGLVTARAAFDPGVDPLPGGVDDRLAGHDVRGGGARHGVPLGIGAGRWIWTLVADQLGVVPAPLLPALAVAVLVPAALLVANVAAAVPAWLAARVRPAEALQAE